jgi:hypothetical protein
MAQITHEVTHGLNLEQAKEVAKLALEHYVQRYGERGLVARWINDTRADVSVSVKGAEVQATVDVLPSVLRIDAKVPLLLRAFKSVAVSKIDSEVKRWIEQVRANAPA